MPEAVKSKPAITDKMLEEAKSDLNFRFQIPVVFSFEIFPTVILGGKTIGAWTENWEAFLAILRLSAPAKEEKRHFVHLQELNDLEQKTILKMRNDIKQAFPDWPKKAMKYLIRIIEGYDVCALAVASSQITFNPSIKHCVLPSINQAVKHLKIAQKKTSLIEETTSKNPEGFSKKVLQFLDKNQALQDLRQAQESRRIIETSLKIIGQVWEPLNGVKQDLENLGKLLK